jgi:hypothetical protein
MDAATLELLLELLNERLDAALQMTDANDRHRGLYFALDLLAEVGRSELLDVFYRNAGSTIEHRLTRYLIEVVGPRQGLDQDCLTREPGVTVLLRMGVRGFEEILCAYLSNSSKYGRLDAMNMRAS